MKILHILNSPRAEGTPRLVLDWLEVESHTQETYFITNSPLDLIEDFQRKSSWVRLDDLLQPGFSKFIKIIYKAAEVCAERQPDVVICWASAFANWIAIGCRLAGVKHILVHAGNPTNKGFKHSLRCTLMMAPLKFTGAKVICCSKYVEQSIKEVTWIEASTHTIWNCAQAEKISHLADQARAQRNLECQVKVGIMVATLEDHKDHVTLIRAMDIVRRKHTQFNLRLVGGGTNRNKLQELIEKLELNNFVELLGSRNDVPFLLGQSDYFIFSTTPQEGLGSVLFEAMAARLPIVASDVPACREALEGGLRGTLVPPRNPEALANAISHLITSSQSPQKLEDNYRFSISLSAENMMNQYLSVLS